MGEVAGKFIFEAEWPGAKLHAFDQVANNELFDYYLESNIAIDFKNWRGMPDVDPQKERQHVIEKLRKLEQNTGRQWHVLIVNVVAINGSQPVPVTDRRILEVPGLIDHQGQLVLTPASKRMIGAIINDTNHSNQ